MFHDVDHDTTAVICTPRRMSLTFVVAQLRRAGISREVIAGVEAGRIPVRVRRKLLPHNIVYLRKGEPLMGKMVPIGRSIEIQKEAPIFDPYNQNSGG